MEIGVDQSRNFCDVTLQARTGKGWVVDQKKAPHMLVNRIREEYCICKTKFIGENYELRERFMHNLRIDLNF